MPRRIVIAPRLPLPELERQYRQARDPVASRHWQIVATNWAGWPCGGWASRAEHAAPPTRLCPGGVWRARDGSGARSL